MQYSDQAILDALDAGILTADPTTGEVFRHGRLAQGKSNGYIAVYAMDRVLVRAHRVVWLSVHRKIKRGHIINHRNRVRDDNRLVNLEETSRSQNALHAEGSTLYQGVRPEDLEEASPTFVAELCSLLGVPHIEDATVLSRLLQDADPRLVPAPVVAEPYDDTVALSPCGEWTQEIQRGVLIGGTRRRSQD